jgi:hypothetical protein
MIAMRLFEVWIHYILLPKHVYSNGALHEGKGRRGNGYHFKNSLRQLKIELVCETPIAMKNDTFSKGRRNNPCCVSQAFVSLGGLLLLYIVQGHQAM